jgi:DNA polymerase-4
MILHIDMDAFFASIEQVVNPKLKGKPLIVGSRLNKLHTVVCAASYEAKALGIDSGMPSDEAFKLCPSLEFVAAAQGKYIWTSEQILGMLKSYGFLVEYVSIDEFQLDIPAETEPHALARDIQKQIQQAFNITASIGVAKNCLLAKLASKLNKPNGIAILDDGNLSQILGKTPVEKLCGVGKASAALLHNLNIQTCLDLYQKSPAFLEQIFGKNGLNLYVSLHSAEHFDTQESDSKPKSVGHSYTLPMASKNPVFIRSWLRLLSEMVAQRLRQRNLVAKTVHLWLNSPEMADLGAQQTFQQATNDGYEIYQRCLRIMSKRGPKMPGIRALGVSCSNIFENAYSPLLKEQKRREALINALDNINNRHGEGTIYPAVVTIARQA